MGHVAYNGVQRRQVKIKHRYKIEEKVYVPQPPLIRHSMITLMLNTIVSIYTYIK